MQPRQGRGIPLVASEHTLDRTSDDSDDKDGQVAPSAAGQGIKELPSQPLRPDALPSDPHTVCHLLQALQEVWGPRAAPIFPLTTLHFLPTQDFKTNNKLENYYSQTQ